MNLGYGSRINPHELLLAQSEQGLTGLHMVAQEYRVGILKALWVWAEQAQMYSSELKKICYQPKTTICTSRGTEKQVLAD